LEWIIGNVSARSSDAFGEFAGLSAAGRESHGIIEGYACKRRGGRRFVMQGCSGNVSNGIASFFRRRYQKRWFILREDYLVYTDGRHEETIRDVLMFDGDFSCEIVSEKEGARGTSKAGWCFQSFKKSRFLKIQNGYRKIILRFESHDEAQIWCMRIRETYSKSDWKSRYEYKSFAPPRESCSAKLLVDGNEYFGDLAKNLSSAKSEIYMSGWWLVPELPLIRPSKCSLIEILRDRAINAGVKIYIILYKELSIALSLESQSAKRSLESISPNIRVILHPKMIGVNAVLAWSHHQKLVIIDQQMAYIGGLDLCLGRYDDANHRLVDPGPIFVFPGKDYCNPCLRDMIDIRDPFPSVDPPTTTKTESNVVTAVDLFNRKCEPRLPWHDVHCRVKGLVVQDIVHHFTQVWNHVKTDKHRRESDFEFLHVTNNHGGQRDGDHGSQRDGGGDVSFDTLSQLDRRGLTIVLDDAVSDLSPDEFAGEFRSGPMRRQDTLGMGIGGMLSMDDASTPGSRIQAATLPVVGGTETTEDTTPGSRWKIWKKKLGEATTLESGPSILLPKREMTEVVVSPSKSSSTSRSSRIQFLRSGSYWSTGLPTECSILNAYRELIEESKNFVYIENQFFVTSSGDGGVRNLIGRSLATRIVQSAFADPEDKFKAYIILPVMPAFENSQLLSPNGFVTRATLQLQFQSLTRGPNSIVGYISSFLMDSRGMGEESALSEALKIFHSHVCVCGLRQIDRWPDSGALVTEQLYIHSKAMIVDDMFAIIGSANINDRSMLGDRDSEIAVLIQDPEFATNMRIKLWEEHFGVSVDSQAVVGAASNTSKYRNDAQCVFKDPESSACFSLWKTTSQDNANIFRDVFGCIPDNLIKTRADFVERMTRNRDRPCVIATDDPRMEQVKQIKGRIVEFQLDFLKEEKNLFEPMPRAAAFCPREVFY